MAKERETYRTRDSAPSLMKTPAIGVTYDTSFRISYRTLPALSVIESFNLSRVMMRWIADDENQSARTKPMNPPQRRDIPEAKVQTVLD